MAFWCFRCHHYIHNGSPEFHNIFCRPRLNNSSRGNHINNDYNNNRNPSYNTRNNNNSNRYNLASRNRNNNNNRYNRNNRRNIRRRDNNNRYHNYHRDNNRHNYYRMERRHQNRINNITYNHANNDNNNRDNILVENTIRRLYLNTLSERFHDFRGNNEHNNDNNNNDNNNDNNINEDNNNNDDNNNNNEDNNNDDNNNESSESIFDSFESQDNNNHGIDEEVLWRLPKSKIPDVNKLGKRQCNICLEDYKNGDELTTLPCFHFFHPNCINQWLISKNICPLCKFEIKLNNEI